MDGAELGKGRVEFDRVTEDDDAVRGTDDERVSPCVLQSNPR